MFPPDYFPTGYYAPSYFPPDSGVPAMGGHPPRGRRYPQRVPVDPVLVEEPFDDDDEFFLMLT